MKTVKEILESFSEYVQTTDKPDSVCWMIDELIDEYLAKEYSP